MYLFYEIVYVLKLRYPKFQFVSNAAHPHFKEVFDMYLKMLTENKTNLAFKVWYVSTKYHQ